MSVPNVQTPELDGGLNIRPPIDGLPLAVVGQCAAGPFDTPASYTRPKDIIDTFVGGRAAESAAYAAERFGVTVVLVRAKETTAHAYSAVDQTAFSGTSVVTVDGTPVPNDDYEVVVRFPTDGTIGVDGIKLEWSVDSGRTFSPPTPLGTAADFTLPGTGGVKIEFAAGTVVAGDLLSFEATAKAGDDDDLDDALEALRQTSLLWQFAHVADVLDASAADVVSAKLAAMHNDGKHRWAMGSFRLPNDGESEADYLTAFNAAFSAFADSSLAIAAGASKVPSSIARRTYTRPAAFGPAALAAALSEEVDLAVIPEGRLLGVTIRDASGNPEAGFHDESVNPGLDDVRALTLRTWEDETGVYVNNPRLMSPIGSDFDFIQKRRVMNLGRTIVGKYFRRRLSRKLRVSKKTGFILESERLSMQAEVDQELAKGLLKKPKASSARVVLNKTDAILQPPYPLTGQLRIQPLAYPKEIIIEVAFVAAQVEAV